MKEYLVGRIGQFEIHRLSFDEYREFRAPITRNEALENIMIYGSYPEIANLTNATEKKLSIKDIYQTYIQKDVVNFLNIDNITAFNNLLIFLANQVSSLINIDALSNSLGISRKNVEKYITILENTFIIKRIYPYYKNYSKEVIKTPKVYFLDLGLRNYIINNFNPLNLRNDI